MQSYEFPRNIFAGKLDEFRPKNFLTAGMFDVLEHIPNDTSALVECAGLLKKMACCTSVPRTGQSCGLSTMIFPAINGGIPREA